MSNDEKAYLDLKFSGLQTQFSELQTGVSDLRSEVSDLRSEVSGLRSEVSGLRSEVSDLRTHTDTKFAEAHAYTDARSEMIETKLLTAFHGWARSMEVRSRIGSSQISGMDERLAFLEERVSGLERKH